MQSRAFFSGVTEVKNPIVGGAVGRRPVCKHGKSASEFVTDCDHLTPDLCDAIHGRLILLIPLAAQRLAPNYDARKRSASAVASDCGTRSSGAWHIGVSVV